MNRANRQEIAWQQARNGTQTRQVSGVECPNRLDDQRSLSLTMILDNRFGTSNIDKTARDGCFSTGS
ncbi:MAG: hypothetical protein WAN46_04830 [Gammaproteobacteria bacterium]|jgi:hypothetical protein